MKKARRRKMLIPLFIVFGIVMILAVAAVLTGVSVNNPTGGAAIGRYDNPKPALLVIDVQNDTTSNLVYGDTAAFVDKVNQAILLAQESGMEIIYIKNEYGNNPLISLLAGGRYKKGTPGADASACVYSTAMGGMNRGCNVNIIQDAIVAASDSAMDKMLRRYMSDGIGIINLMQFRKITYS